MHRIDSTGAVDGLFVPGNPETNTPPTYYTASWSNALQEEIANVIEGAGMLLNKSSNTQLREAINEFITLGLQNAGSGSTNTGATLTSAEVNTAIQAALENISISGGDAVIPDEWDGGEL
jgi:hypothetical protein